MLYDEKCPICGTVNRQLNLDETNGWFECEKCKNTVNNLTVRKKSARVPLLKTNEDIKKYFGIT